MTTITIENRDTVRIIWIDHPPVNALSIDVRRGVAEALDAIEADATARGVVLACRGKTFFSGADIREFDKPPEDPILTDLCARIADFPIPVVAAMHGAVLGGGLEVALACRSRAAAIGCVIGLPETTLGLIPGAGGTQRLPRMIGAAQAARMIAHAETVDAGAGARLGVIDAVVRQEELLDAACALAMTPPAARPEVCLNREDLASLKTEIAARYPLEPARSAAVDAVDYGVAHGLEAGLKEERRRFLDLKASPEARALRRMFFAERASGKPTEDRKGAARGVNVVAVVGAGAMGRGIAAAALRAGRQVVLCDVDQGARTAARDAIESILQRDAAKGRLSGTAADALQRLSAASDLRAASNADLVVEAIVERMDAKRLLFEELSRIIKDDAVLATNTSYLDVDAIAAASGRPQDVIGLHFFNPAHVMRLVEVVDGAATHPDTLATGLAFAKALRKIPVISGVGWGFIGNRIWQGYQREAGLMLLETRDPEPIDAAMRAFGLPMGPFQALDLAGLDIGHAMREARDEADFEPRAFHVHDALVAAGMLGRKVGAGFYRHEGAAASRHEAALDIIAAEADRQNAPPRLLDDDEIVERCLLAMTVEAAGVLQDGVARSPEDVDVVLVHGYGFPRAKGGPMFQAEARGWAETKRAVAAYADRFGPRWWTPPPWLNERASQ